MSNPVHVLREALGRVAKDQSGDAGTDDAYAALADVEALLEAALTIRRLEFGTASEEEVAALDALDAASARLNKENV